MCTDQENHEKIYARQQYSNQPIFQEPPMPEAYFDSEDHSQMGGPLEY